MASARALTLRRTLIGQKAVMAVSGVALFGFLIAHLAGNLQLLSPNGPEAMAEYAASLRRMLPVLWALRIGLIVAAVAHIWAAVVISVRNTDARGHELRYRHKRKDLVTDYAARTMMWSGPIVLMFFVFHLAHLTFGMGPSQFDHQNPYNNVVYGFLDWRVSTIYIVANILLGLHLFHGAWSWFQSLGLNHRRYNPLRRWFAIGLAAFITLGNVAIPVSVMTGFVQPTTETFCFDELAITDGECDGFEGGTP